MQIKTCFLLFLAALFYTCQQKTTNDSNQTRLKSVYIGGVRPTSGYIESLIIIGMDMPNLAGIDELKHLKKVIIDASRIADYSDLKKVPHIELLALRRISTVKDISFLAYFTNLHSLKINDTKVESIDSLSGLVQLKTLDISNTLVHDISPLSHTKIEWLKMLKIDPGDGSNLPATLKHLIISKKYQYRMPALKSKLPDCTIVLSN
ncbi:MAG: leucine-rich repeat domain-containing protein [Leptospiraceae bacterium]|nr:leucine-rich repeat domain-containing protein [Leptospiraceae bacterium]